MQTPEQPEQSATNQIVVFTLDEQRYALPLSAVERVIRAVEITPLPKAPEVVLGVIDAQGQVIPVVDVRKRFRLPSRPVDEDDRFILARTSRRRVALIADSVAGVHEAASQEMESAVREFPFLEHIQGVARTPDGLILINNLDRFLSLDEEQQLDAALPERAE
ncbi:MAG: chemotaxis protein CheW [candidate division WOR-3 bacterium]|nr:chemotaxis protein CheW [candidate division WOR-3 bacterium]